MRVGIERRGTWTPPMPRRESRLQMVRDRRVVAALFRPRWWWMAVHAAQALGLGFLLAAGTVLTINQQHPRYTQPTVLLELPGAVIRAVQPSEEAFRISQVLRRYTRNPQVADRVANAVVREGHRNRIDPSLLVGMILVESDMDPSARSFVGARGLMQVMPLHRGKWGCGSSDLYNIESNICHGVSVLADNIRNAPNLRVALQRYNGCVHGRNTPGCGRYWTKVLRARERTRTQLTALRTINSE
jgi:soluble lytic murein transglycosylase-like protein